MCHNHPVRLISLVCAIVLLGSRGVFSSEFQLFDPGSESVVDYAAYGEFSNVGTSDYRYFIKDRDGLAHAVGEGIYPNVDGLLHDPLFKKMQAEKKLEGSEWDFLNSDNPQANFYKWASTHNQPAGVKQFYIAMMLEKMGLYAQAVKAYEATVIHFPKAFGNTSWKTPWYVGPSALDSVSFLIRKHPELGMGLQGGRIRIRNRFDDDTHNDRFEIDPGRIILQKVPVVPPTHVDLTSLTVQKQLGQGNVHLTQYTNGHWQLFVDKVPYLVRGMSYSATPVGKSPDNGTLVVHRDWMVADQNKNGKIDGPYDSWVDKNRNNQQDSHEPVVGDFKLMKDMGVNTLRIYHHGYNKKLLQDLFHTYGIRVIMGDFLGAYTIGSDAEWAAGTDYRDPVQQERMLASVRQMVTEYKDEPYLLFWVLGNENNFGNANNSREVPEVYYSFLNKAAQLIKSLDPDHPVALSNGDLQFIDKAAKLCPDVDIFGANAYRGLHGMGDSFWRDAADEWAKPMLISEFGCPAYHRHKSEADAEALQAEYLRGSWDDIEWNVGGGPGVGNGIGGVLFEWMDEWWKAGAPPTFDPAVHDTVGQFGGPFPDGWSYEEWYGIVSQGDGKNSPFERQLRKAYFMFKDELWNHKEWKKRGLP